MRPIGIKIISGFVALCFAGFGALGYVELFTGDVVAWRVLVFGTAFIALGVAVAVYGWRRADRARARR